MQMLSIWTCLKICRLVKGCTSSGPRINSKMVAYLALYSIDTYFDTSTSENIVGKGEIARYEQFLLFPHFFLLNQIAVSPFVRIFDIISLFSAEVEEPKIAV